MANNVRYEINHNCEIVEHESALCADMDKMINDLFSQFGWTSSIENKQGSCRTVLLSDANGKTKSLNVFCGTIRNESRNAYEKKIQLGTVVDPRTKNRENTIILGIYVFESNDSVQDAIFVGYPIDENIRYNTNPSIRRTFVNHLLIEAKTNGFVYDKENNTVGFRAEFIYYYLNNYMNFHYNRNEDRTTVDNNGPIDTHIEELSIEWFKEKAKEFPEYDSEAKKALDDFLFKYNVEYLDSLNENNILTEVFLNQENKHNLCYELEFNTKLREYFGSIKSGTSYKYGLFYSTKNNSWMTGSSVKPIYLEKQTASDLGRTIKDNLIAGAKIIRKAENLNTEDDYLNLYEQLDNATDGYINKIWFVKYYQMLRPDILPPIYSNAAQKTVCKALKIKANDNAFCRLAQINFYAKKCGISNWLFNKIFWTYATSIIDDENIGENDMEDEARKIYHYDNSKNSGLTNLIVYGTPGCGKSYFVKNNLLKDYNESNIIRTTFYQEYTNTDFVGQIMPYVSGENVTYKFNPGPFALALKQSIQNPTEKIALVIEELNRGNAPSIFGDIFQLLDREDGRSEYQITNVNVQKYLEQEIPEYIFNYIMIPSNLSIIATMNTSDQNVFTLDTAFKRRWEFLKLKNVFKTSGEDAHPYRNYYVPGMNGMKWQTFVDSINEYIIDSATDLQSEDKQLGVFFVSKNMLYVNELDSNEAKVRTFAYKVLEYLWDDVAKFDRDSWFNNKIRTLDELVEEYIRSGKEVFKDGVFKE